MSDDTFSVKLAKQLKKCSPGIRALPLTDKIQFQRGSQNKAIKQLACSEEGREVSHSEDASRRHTTLPLSVAASLKRVEKRCSFFQSKDHLPTSEAKGFAVRYRICCTHVCFPWGRGK